MVLGSSSPSDAFHLSDMFNPHRACRRRGGCTSGWRTASSSSASSTSAATSRVRARGRALFHDPPLLYAQSGRLTQSTTIPPSIDCTHTSTNATSRAAPLESRLPPPARDHRHAQSPPGAFLSACSIASPWPIGLIGLFASHVSKKPRKHRSPSPFNQPTNETTTTTNPPT